MDQQLFAEHKPEAAETKPELPKPEKPKTSIGAWWGRTQESFQAMLPKWVVDNSTRINQLGLMAGTAVIVGSAWRNKTISHDIWNAQVKLIEQSVAHLEESARPAAIAEKIAEACKRNELIKGPAMKKPGLHKQRMFYLGTAITGLGIGGFVKDKETPEEREAHKDMSLPQYMGMRLKHAFDPVHHSRQTAGVVGATSGVLAIISAFTQPGGALISEAFVGATLCSGFAGLTFFDDPAKAKQWLNVCWATRLPFVITGTYETLATVPKFVNPIKLKEIETSTAYKDGVIAAMRDGVPNQPRFALGLGPKLSLAGRKTVYGGKAAEAYTKGFVSEELQKVNPKVRADGKPDKYLRRDWSYPVGQWFNMAMATFGFLTANADKTKHAGGQQVVADAKPLEKEPALASIPTTETHALATPSLVVNGAQTQARLATAPEQTSVLAQA